MVKAPVPLGDVPLGGQWYELQTPIPLPQGGRQIRYRILITDRSGNEIAIPSEIERNIVKVPEGPNIAIGTRRNEQSTAFAMSLTKIKMPINSLRKLSTEVDDRYAQILKSCLLREIRTRRGR